jgi:hypothetical protein
MGEKLLEGLCENHVLADEAYDSDSIRESVKPMWAKACIKPKGNRKARKWCVKKRYQHRISLRGFWSFETLSPHRHPL